MSIALSRLSARLQLTLRERLAEIRQRLRRDLLDPYRPELHYMRGPGPRWREKHGQVPV